MAASADYHSGRRARPGRQVSADLLKLSERTVERHWRLLERVGMAIRTASGQWLTRDARTAVYADSDQRDRWRDRQEWHLVMPEWARDLPENVDLDPYEERARALLAALAYGKPVDNSGAADLVLRRRVAPSSGGQALRCWIPLREARSLRPDGRKSKGGRPPGVSSPTSGGEKRRPRSTGRRSIPPHALSLARGMHASQRFAWLRDAPRYLVAQVVRRLQDWTPDDVADECDRRMAAADMTYGQLHHPASFLRWLLQEADPARPPRQLAHAEQAARGDRHRARTAAGRSLAGPVSHTLSVDQAREQARAAAGAAHRLRAAGRRGAERAAAEQAAAAVARPVDRLAAATAYLEHDLGLVCVGCGAGDAEHRATPTIVPLCADCWRTIQPALGA